MEKVLKSLFTPLNAGGDLPLPLLVEPWDQRVGLETKKQRYALTPYAKATALGNRLYLACSREDTIAAIATPPGFGGVGRAEANPSPTQVL